MPIVDNLNLNGAFLCGPDEREERKVKPPGADMAAGVKAKDADKGFVIQSFMLFMRDHHYGLGIRVC